MPYIKMKGEPADPYLIHYTFDARNEAVKDSVRDINFQNYVAKHLKGKAGRTDSHLYMSCGN
jgi:hypothetical protein